MMFKKKTHTLMGYGIPLSKPESPIKKIWLKDAHRRAHFFCFGTTTIGKTRLITNLLRQDIQKGNSIVIIDPKGDNELVSSVVQDAFAAGRKDDLSLVTPIYPELSAKLDPLSYYFMPEELVSHIVSGIKAKEEFFINTAYETTLVIVLSLLIFRKMDKDQAAHINIKAIKQRCSYDGLKGLLNGLQDVNTEEAEEVRLAISQVLSSPPDYFSKISSSLRTVLTSLTIGNVGQIIGKASANRFIQRLEKGEGVILIVQTGSLLTRKTSIIVARVLVSMIQSFVGRRYASGRKVDPPLSLYIDEFSNVAYREIADLFSKSASANVWIHAFTQSIADLNDEIGEDASRKILDNCNTKQFMRVNDPRTAEYISNYSGTIKRFSPILDAQGNIIIKEMEEPAVKTEDVLNLHVRDFYLFSFDGAYKGRCVPIDSPLVNIEYPQINVV